MSLRAVLIEKTLNLVHYSPAVCHDIQKLLFPRLPFAIKQLHGVIDAFLHRFQYNTEKFESSPDLMVIGRVIFDSLDDSRHEIDSSPDIASCSAK